MWTQIWSTLLAFLPQGWREEESHELGLFESAIFKFHKHSGKYHLITHMIAKSKHKRDEGGQSKFIVKWKQILKKNVWHCSHNFYKTGSTTLILRSHRTFALLYLETVPFMLQMLYFPVLLPITLVFMTWKQDIVPEGFIFSWSLLSTCTLILFVTSHLVTLEMIMMLETSGEKQQ